MFTNDGRREIVSRITQCNECGIVLITPREWSTKVCDTCYLAASDESMFAVNGATLDSLSDEGFTFLAHRINTNL
jgi:hypothetical protein